MQYRKVKQRERRIDLEREDKRDQKGIIIIRGTTEGEKWTWRKKDKWRKEED